MSWAEVAGVPAHAVTDHGCLTALYPFFLAARRTAVRPLFGVEAYFDAREGESDASIDRLDRTHLILIAKTLEGFRNLVRINNAAWQKGFRPPRYAVVNWDMLEKFHPGLICTTACVGGPVAIAVRRGRYERAEAIYKKLHDLFGADFYPEVAAHPIPDQPPVNQAVLAYARRSARPAVLTNDCHYFKSEDWFTHNLYIKTSEKTPKTFSYNATCFYLRTPEEMRRLGFPAAYSDETLRVAESCTAYEELRARLAQGFKQAKGRPVSLFPIRSVRISARMALADTLRVMRVSPGRMKELLGNIRAADTLEEARRRSRLVQTFARKYPFLWSGARGLEGLPRSIEPDFSSRIDLDEEWLSYIPVRSIDGMTVADVEPNVLRELGVRVRASRPAERSPMLSRQAYYEGLRHWWNDDFGRAADIFEKAICGDVPVGAYFRLSECLSALGKKFLARNILQSFISTSPDPAAPALGEARRALVSLTNGNAGLKKKTAAAVSIDHAPDFSVLYLKRQLRESEIRQAVGQVERILESDVGVVAVNADAACRRSPFFLPLLIGLDAFLRRYRGRVYRIGPRGAGRLLNRWFPARPTFGDVSREVPRDVALRSRAAPELAFHAHTARRTIRHSQLIRSRLPSAVLRDAGGRTWRLPVTNIDGKYVLLGTPRTRIAPERARVELELGRDAAVSETALTVQSEPRTWRVTAPSMWNLRPLRVGRRKACRLAVRVVSCTPGGVPDIEPAEMTELSLSGCVLRGGGGFASNESVAMAFVDQDDIVLAAWKIRSDAETSIWAFYDYEPSIRSRMVRAFSLAE